jgi:hypothetical protein
VYVAFFAGAPQERRRTNWHSGGVYVAFFAGAPQERRRTNWHSAHGELLVAGGGVYVACDARAPQWRRRTMGTAAAHHGHRGGAP